MKLNSIVRRVVMTRTEFMDEVVKTYFSNDCKVKEAIDITVKRLGISNTQFIEWFGRDRSEQKNIRGR